MWKLEIWWKSGKFVNETKKWKSQEIWGVWEYGKRNERRNRNVDNSVEKIWITKKIKGTGVKKSGNKKISKKICEKLYFSIFAANAWLYGLFCI